MKTPKLVARFLPDEAGRPKVVKSDGTKHFTIELLVKDAPKDAFGVTYTLHDSYYDPVREVLGEAASGFPEEVTSYGDYRVRARVRSSDGSFPVSAKLSEALRAFYGEELPPEIADAIQTIEKK